MSGFDELLTEAALLRQWAALQNRIRRIERVNGLSADTMVTSEIGNRQFASQLSAVGLSPASAGAYLKGAWRGDLIALSQAIRRFLENRHGTLPEAFDMALTDQADRGGRRNES